MTYFLWDKLPGLVLKFYDKKYTTYVKHSQPHSDGKHCYLFTDFNKSVKTFSHKNFYL